MGRSVLLLVNRDKADAGPATEELRELIGRRGKVALELSADNTLLPEKLPPLDLIVVLGGDGTLLGQARRCLHLGLPLLGVNLGRLGFMAEFDLASVRLQADSLFGDGPLAIRKHGLLHASVRDGDTDHERYEGPALNDVVITAGPPYRLIQLTLTIDGTPGPTVSGDGLIISTPTGTTAYNLSAGGPIVAPTVDATTITPIAPQSLAFRPICLSSSSIVEVHVQRVNTAPHGFGTTLVLDGQVHKPLKLNDRILVTSHSQHARFVRNPATDYWSRLINKLHWARAPRTRQGG